MNKHVKVAVGVVENSAGQILIAQRREGQHLAGLWEFPGGKVELDETPEQALARELQEEVAISVLSAKWLFTIDHSYPAKKVSLLTFHVSQFSGEARGKEGQPLRWVSKQDLDQFDFPEANEAILDYLAG